MGILLWTVKARGNGGGVPGANPTIRSSYVHAHIFEVCKGFGQGQHYWSNPPPIWKPNERAVSRRSVGATKNHEDYSKRSKRKAMASLISVIYLQGAPEIKTKCPEWPPVPPKQQMRRIRQTRRILQTTNTTKTMNTTKLVKKWRIRQYTQLDWQDFGR